MKSRKCKEFTPAFRRTVRMAFRTASSAGGRCGRMRTDFIKARSDARQQLIYAARTCCCIFVQVHDSVWEDNFWLRLRSTKLSVPKDVARHTRWRKRGGTQIE